MTAHPPQTGNPDDALPPPLPADYGRQPESQHVGIHRDDDHASGNDHAVIHVTEQTRTYPCPNCGANLSFDPESQALGCASCGSLIPIADRTRLAHQIEKKDLEPAMKELVTLVSTKQVSTDKEVVCQSCGGHTLFSGTLTATKCPYCATPIQRDDIQVAPTRLPYDGIIPLKVSQDLARKSLETWINSRRFAPNAFKEYRTLGQFSAIYLPYFVYDGQAVTTYRGRCGIDRIVTTTDSEGKTHSRIVTDWYPASGTVGNTFKNVPGQATTGLDSAMIDRLEPWPMEYTCDYSPVFTAGHLSRTYDRDAQQVLDASVMPRMQTQIDMTIRRDIGGDHQHIIWSDSTWNYLRFCQLALPMWMLTVTYKNKPYNVCINGVTGEVQGRRPWSVAKILLLILVIMIVGLTLSAIIYYTQGYTM